MKRTIVAVLFLLAVAASAFADEAYFDKVIEEIIAENDQVKIGILVDIKNSNLSKAEKDEKADMVTNKMQELFLKTIDRKKVKIIERAYLNKILEEQKMSASGFTEGAIKLGKIADLDIMCLLVAYQSHVTVKVIRVDTGEIMLTQVIETPQVEQPASQELADHTFTVGASTYRTYEWNLKEGATLKISFSSNLDINVWFLDGSNCLKFERGREFSYYRAASGQRIYNSNFNIMIPETGNYCFILDNKFSLFTPKAVSVRAVVTE